jgi:Stage II sporulation protein E (SpoIIE)
VRGAGVRSWALRGSLVACGAFVAAGGASAAVALGRVPSTAVTVPSVSVPSVSVPSATVPSVTLPVTVPSVTTATVTTPPVSTPSITPTISTPSLPVRTVTTPLGGGLPTGSHSSSPSTDASRAAASQPAAASAAGATSSGTATTVHSVHGTAPRVASTGRGSTASPARVGARRAPSARTVHPGLSAVATGIGAGAPAGRGTLAAPAARSTEQATSSGPFPRLVKELPTAALFALLAFAVIAAAMALNAYLQSRRAKSLAGQRAALLSDVGVLQAALLPAVPERLGDLDVSVAYRPAQGLAAGGDFFDVFTMSAEKTGIIIGDVSGHGRESLIHAALVRYTLRTLMGEGHPLPDVLARADRYLTGELGDGFATVIICCYEHATGELTWAKAGHEPPILAGQPDHEEQAATPLGFGLGDHWPQFSRFLARGERVCLFTDGLIEARRHGEQLGRAHLRSLVEQGLSAQGLVDRIQSDSDDCSDDLAAVVISRAGAVAIVPAAPAPVAATVS